MPTSWRKVWGKRLWDEDTFEHRELKVCLLGSSRLLRQTFVLGCCYSGKILSYQKMVGQLQDTGNTTTIAHYLRLLGEAGLICGLEKYYEEAVRERASSPKLAVSNNALRTAMQPGFVMPRAWLIVVREFDTIFPK